jgi:hypothetical protein
VVEITGGCISRLRWQRRPCPSPRSSVLRITAGEPCPTASPSTGTAISGHYV